MSNVVPLGGITRLDVPTDRVLEAAKGHCSDGGTVLWLMEMAKIALLEAVE